MGINQSLKPLQSLDDIQAFHEILGFRQVQWQEGLAVLELDLRPYHLNLGGVVHGGVLSSLLDIACAQAGLYCPERSRKAITLSLTTTFTGQVNGGLIRTIGTLRSQGRRIFNSSGEILDSEGRLLAMGEGTFRIRS